MRAPTDFTFGEQQLHEVLTILQEAVPPRLAALLQQKTPARDVLEGVRGNTLLASLTFQPTSSSLVLLGSMEQADGRARAAVPYTLLCEVVPL